MTDNEPAELAAARDANRKLWDERVAVHLAPGGYDLDDLRRGTGRLNAIEEAELAADVGPVAGLRVIHLQCHFGRDTLILAQRGAAAVGVDFSPPAIAAARALAAELGLADQTRFVEGDLYDAPRLVGEAGSFDLAYVTWGALIWLPDIRGWARVVAQFLKPGGRLYLAEVHPAVQVLDDAAKDASGMPGWFVPYFAQGPQQFDTDADYANPTAVLEHTRSYEWTHPIGAVVTALIEAGLELRFLREHDRLSWRAFDCLVQNPDGTYRWPDRPWLPLSYSLLAEKTA